MPTKDTSELKAKIISRINKKGPSLPVHISTETGISMLFASAFLSELLSEKKLKLSNMRVGSSPLYLIPGQEHLLENFSQHLKSKEKEAFQLLQEKKLLKDKDQDPAIRVALRAIKDFAIPFKRNNEIYWRYFTKPESEINTKEGQQETQTSIKEKPLNIFEKSETIPEIKKPIIKKHTIKKQTTKKPLKKRNISQKKNEKFFNKIKEFLSENNIQILDIETFSKNDLILKVKDNEQEKLLIAYNRKRINETDILKASKRATEENLQYIILSLGEPSKKLTNLIKAIKTLSSIKKLK